MRITSVLFVVALAACNSAPSSGAPALPPAAASHDTTTPPVPSHSIPGPAALTPMPRAAPEPPPPRRPVIPSRYTLREGVIAPVGVGFRQWVRGVLRVGESWQVVVGDGRANVFRVHPLDSGGANTTAEYATPLRALTMWASALPTEPPWFLEDDRGEMTFVKFVRYGSRAPRHEILAAPEPDWWRRRNWVEMRPGAPPSGVMVFLEESRELLEGPVVTHGIAGPHTLPIPARTRALVVPVGPAAHAPIALPAPRRPGWEWGSAAAGERFSAAVLQNRTTIVALLFDADGRLRFQREQPTEFGQSMRAGVTQSGSVYALLRTSDFAQKLVGFSVRGRALQPRDLRFEDAVEEDDAVVFSCGETHWLAAVANGEGEERVLVTTLTDQGEILPPSIVWSHAVGAATRRVNMWEHPRTFCTDGHPSIVFSLAHNHSFENIDVVRVEWE